MTTFATHFQTVGSLDLKMLKSKEQLNDDASDELSEMYNHHVRGSTSGTSPFIQRPSVDGIPTNFADDECLVFSDESGRTFHFMHLSGSACLIYWQSEQKNLNHFVPWTFEMTDEFTLGDHTFISNNSLPWARFRLKDSLVELYLLEGRYGKDDNQRVNDLRALIQDQIKSEVIRIVDAFSTALPLATGPYFLKDALDHKAAIPPFLNHEALPRGRYDAKGFVKSTLGPYLEATFPDMHKLGGQIYGRVIQPDGRLTNTSVKIVINDQDCPQIAQQVLDLLCSENTPIPLTLQISQSGGTAAILSFLSIYRIGQLSAHEKITARIKMDDLMARSAA